MASDLTPTARRAVDAWLDAVDTAAPGLVVGAHVIGSIAAGDFHEHASDVDVVAICAEDPAGPTLDALAGSHRPSTPHVDVTYLTADQLGEDPRTLSPPHSHEGTFEPGGGFMANPVTWRELATHAVAVRGEPIDPASVWFDAGALRRWNLDNLDTYWVGQVAQWRAADLSDPGLADAVVRSPYGLPWFVLGPPRLHFTIATLEVTSKSGAGRHALATVDERWHEVVRTALALRADPTAELPAPAERLRTDAVDLAEWLIEDAHRLAG